MQAVSHHLDIIHQNSYFEINILIRETDIAFIIFIVQPISKWVTRALDRRGHSLEQHTQFLKNNLIDENDFFYETLIQSIEPTRSHLARFARTRFALRAHENF